MEKVQSYRGFYFLLLVWILGLISVQAKGIQYYHGDSLGSSILATDEQGKVTQTILYSPYGETLLDASSAEGKSSSPFYTGQELDASTDLYDYGARCYDPALSRLLSVDPIRDETNPQDLNLYSYAWNNPLSITDPSGMEEKKEPPVAYLDPLITPEAPQEEIDTLVHILRAVTTHYNLKLWYADKTYGIPKLDEFLPSVRSESSEFSAEDFSPFPTSQYEALKDVIVHWVRNVITERSRLNKIYEEVGRASIGMTIEQALAVAPSEPPREIWYEYDPRGRRSINLAYPGKGSRFLSSPPQIKIALETGQVRWVDCLWN